MCHIWQKLLEGEHGRDDQRIGFRNSENSKFLEPHAETTIFQPKFEVQYKPALIIIFISRP